MSYIEELFPEKLDLSAAQLITRACAEVDRLRAELAELRRDRERLRAVLAELLAAVTSKGAPDTTEPICWSGSAYQNRRIYAAIDAARGAGRKEHGHE